MFYHLELKDIWLMGGGLTGIQILPDDEIEIVNDEVTKFAKFQYLIRWKF